MADYKTARPGLGAGFLTTVSVPAGDAETLGHSSCLLNLGVHSAFPDASRRTILIAVVVGAISRILPCDRVRIR